MKEIELVRKEAFRRGYSPRTINTYVTCLNNFFRQCHKEPKKVTKNDIYNYLDRMIIKGKAGSTINVNLAALHFLFSQILHKRLLINIKYSKQRKRLPEVLSKEELLKLFNAIKNKKHKLMILLMYSAGLRVSEMLNLKVRDLNINEEQGWVREGKGGKDRRFIIADKLKEELNCWVKNKEYTDFLFTSYRGKMSASTTRVILKKAAKKAGIKKNVHPHMMRHCFGTDVIKNGYTETELQPLMGHNNIETTRGYVHVANVQMTRVKSPYDSLTKSP